LITKILILAISSYNMSVVGAALTPPPLAKSG
jgi:hypothetical protein